VHKYFGEFVLAVIGGGLFVNDASVFQSFPRKCKVVVVFVSVNFLLLLFLLVGGRFCIATEMETRVCWSSFTVLNKLAA